jgi:prophage DNA circulation protein
VVALANLAPSSFRGARFLTPRDHFESGRNAISHRFPAKPSTSHYIEDNGGDPNTFHLTAYLHGPTLMSDWSRLRSALDEPGPGTLNHPWLGAVLVQHKGPYKVQRDDKDSGVLEITLTFIQTAGAIYPSLGGVIAASLSGLAGTSVAAALGALAGSLKLPSSPISVGFINSIVDGVTGAVHDNFGATATVSAAADVLDSSGVRALAGSAAIQGLNIPSSISGSDTVSIVTQGLKDFANSGLD